MVHADPVFRGLEAESVSYVVVKHFGLIGLASPIYVAPHGADSSMILEHPELIHFSAVEILSALEVTVERLLEQVFYQNNGEGGDIAADDSGVRVVGAKDRGGRL